MNERDMTSHITTRPRDVPVEYGDTGAPVDVEGADSVQETLTGRPTELVALHHYDHPGTLEGMTDEEFTQHMLAQGMVRCQGRCGRYRHFSDFSVDARNSGRLFCHAFCKECRAVMMARKRLAANKTQPVLPYEYRKRREKKRKRKG